MLDTFNINRSRHVRRKREAEEQDTKKTVVFFALLDICICEQ